MWSKLFYLTTLVMLAVRAEPPTQRPPTSYAAAGWRPQKPFNLPGEYLPPPPPAEIEQQRQQYPVGFEISKARVDYVGQVQQKQFSANTLRQPKNQYAPPNKQQELPFKTYPQQYKPQQAFFPKPDSQQAQQPRKPAQKYGPPPSVNFNINYPDPRNLEESTFTSGGDISDFEAFERELEPRNNARAKQGQYFILGPDKTIQRVLFTTSQDEEERRTNGFTAQLKYTPVGELKDPVFRYNNEGQLVRVLKK